MGGKAGVVVGGVCVIANTDKTPNTDTNPDDNPQGPQEGDACSIDGKEGTIDANGNCVPNQTAGPSEGDACSINGQDGTIDANGNCIPNQANNDGDACVTADGAAGVITGGVCVATNTNSNNDNNDNDNDNDNDGDDEGEGEGEGEEGEGEGRGNGNGMFAGVTGTGANSPPTWGPLFPAYQFKPKHKPAPTIGQRLFADLFEGR